ncbi:PREDICTED: uncharacterized protein LOC105461500 [Wasmannia auropunctata]|uniref:uncharacterized protein LOC105461500 n=1 Tax=Wasmannia auropunctata TaxID=64793 RepID=UPI0005EF5699|nr:PREDICTED: uncharacterized protein LOC105461500 [Wasmannia auropunctata]
MTKPGQTNTGNRDRSEQNAFANNVGASKSYNNAINRDRAYAYNERPQSYERSGKSALPQIRGDSYKLSPGKLAEGKSVPRQGSAAWRTSDTRYPTYGGQRTPQPGKRYNYYDREKQPSVTITEVTNDCEENARPRTNSASHSDVASGDSVGSDKENVIYRKSSGGKKKKRDSEKRRTSKHHAGEPTAQQLAARERPRVGGKYVKKTPENLALVNTAQPVLADITYSETSAILGLLPTPAEPRTTVPSRVGVRRHRRTPAACPEGSPPRWRPGTEAAESGSAPRVSGPRGES